MDKNTIIVLVALIAFVLFDACAYYVYAGNINFNFKLNGPVPVGTWVSGSSVITFYDNNTLYGWTDGNITWSKTGNEIDLYNNGTFFTAAMYNPNTDSISGYERVV